MMTNPQHIETMVSDHRSSLLREARVHRLRRRTVRAVVRTAAPTVRSGNLARWPAPAHQPVPQPARVPAGQPASADRHLQPV
jgi:hypothetical protein